jgi:hypothetical protein
MEPNFFKEHIVEAVQNTENIHDLPLSFVEKIRSLKSELTPEQYIASVALVRDWVEYTRENKFENSTDSFEIRYFLQKFAAEKFGTKSESIELQNTAIENVTYQGKTFREILEQKTNSDILDDSDFVIVGGTARTALKMYLGLDIESELPINDVDVIASKNEDLTRKSEKYGLDIAGTKVTIGDIFEASIQAASKVDISMNEVFIYDGKLYYSDDAKNDTTNGTIRVRPKDDPLFGSEALLNHNGETYIERTGFYRALAFLLREKGTSIIVSQENIDAEKDNIGRYWLVLLFVKIGKMKDEKLKAKAVGNWFQVAKKIGSTETETPIEFLRELQQKFPGTRMGGPQKEIDTDGQVRWLIGKLTSRSIEHVSEVESIKKIPETYTSANIMLPSTQIEFDSDEFWDALLNT